MTCAIKKEIKPQIKNNSLMSEKSNNISPKVDMKSDRIKIPLPEKRGVDTT